mmetsp:Transcript_7529/g.20823  ORF Transcript_7529/g.20823 Transcript_7529/m.20823 type:complete len:96 (-) Transcript_7529:440-727(-)
MSACLKEKHGGSSFHGSRPMSILLSPVVAVAPGSSTMVDQTAIRSEDRGRTQQSTGPRTEPNDDGIGNDTVEKIGAHAVRGGSSKETLGEIGPGY